jgi:amino acid adenylation domain-containing protein
MNEIVEPTQKMLMQQSNNLPLSPEQQSLLSNREGLPFSALALVIKINGELDQPRLQRALQQVLKAQGILGNKFFEVAAYRGIRQSSLNKEQVLTLESIDDLNEQDLWQSFIDNIENKRQSGFAHDSDWFTKVFICKINEQRYGLAMIVADLITDKTGLYAFWQALFNAYKTDESLLADDENIPQYSDYIEWRIDIAKDEEDVAEGKKYWQQHLSKKAQQPVLPYSLAEVAQPKHDEMVENVKENIKESVIENSYSSEIVVIDNALQEKLEKLVQQVDQPVSLLLQSSWWWLLAKISGQKTIQVGWSHDCRQDYEFFSESMGIFEKVLPLSLTIEPEQNIFNWMETVADILEEHKTWQESWQVELPATTAHLAYGFGLKYIFEDLDDKVTTNTHWAVSSVKGGELPFNLSLLVGLENSKPSELALRYQNQRYSRADIQTLLEQYQTLLVNLTSIGNTRTNNATDFSHPSFLMLSSTDAFISENELKCRQHFEKIGKVESFEKAEKVNKDTQKNNTLADYISAWSKNTPDQIALTLESTQLTYAQLEERVKLLAVRLRSQGIKTDSIVALALPRSINLVVSILAIWRLSAAWVPLDLQWPTQRKCMIIEQSTAALTISDSVHWPAETDEQSKSQDKTKILLLDEPDEHVLDDVVLNAIELSTIEFSPVSLQQAAYIIFTSGSTGTPKGVIIEHSQLVNYVTSASKQLELENCKSYAMTSTVAADLGHTSLFSALFNGATLHIANDHEIQDGTLFTQFIQKNKIDCLKIVPSHLNALLDLDTDSTSDNIALPSTLILGGESIPPSLVSSIFNAEPSCRLFNHYGPTEATVGVLYHQLHIDENIQQGIPLSHAFENCQVIILDNNMQKVPTGALGELYIGGQQLCRGYLTKNFENVFIDNPFNAGEQLYRTGDLARYLPNGSIQLCGRQDHQVKIRGFRIELAEVEQILLKQPDIIQAVVCTWQPDENKDASNQQLIAYVQQKVQRKVQGEKEQTTEEWLQSTIDSLPDVLPSAMLPAHVFQLDHIPRLANGKIDRKSLSSPEELIVNNEFTTPSSALEELLAGEMAELLNLEKISTSQSFFNLGGHSLLIIKLVSRLRKQLQVDIHPGVVFDNPSIIELAVALNNDGGVIPEKLERTALIRLKLNSMTHEQREALLAKSNKV